MRGACRFTVALPYKEPYSYPVLLFLYLSVSQPSISGQRTTKYLFLCLTLPSSPFQPCRYGSFHGQFYLPWNHMPKNLNMLVS